MASLSMPSLLVVKLTACIRVLVHTLLVPHFFKKSPAMYGMIGFIAAGTTAHICSCPKAHESFPAHCHLTNFNINLM